MKLFISLLIPLLVGAVAGYFTSKGVSTWYVTLNKPSFNPPNWLFGPVWTTLYVLMGVGLYLVWKKPDDTIGRNIAITIFFIHLVFNFFWSFIFFAWQKPNFAFVEIVMLWLSIVATIYFFYKVDRTAALIQIPYLCWVSFATVLNFAIWQLNK
jgi:translocator protein